MEQEELSFQRALYEELLVENQRLRQHVALLERQVADAESIKAALREAEAKYRSIFENSVEGIFQTTPDGRYLSANPALAQLYGYASPAELMAQLTSIQRQLYVDPRRRVEFVSALEQHGAIYDFVSEIYRRDGSTIWILENARAVRDAAGQLLYYEGTVQDISERRRAEQAVRRSREQEEIIRGQESMLEELSTPLVPISDHVVLMPLIGALDVRRAQQMVQSVLHGVVGNKARMAILDITGVPVVDAAVANALMSAARAVRMLGAQVVLTGIRPEVAQTLVSLGADLSQLVTRGTLQSGIAYALQRTPLSA